MPSETTGADRNTVQDIEAPSQAAIDAFYIGMKPFWHPVMWECDLPERSIVRVELLGVGIAVARLNGEICAMRDLCRHFQARLSLGEIIDLADSEALMCGYHGWAYGNDGMCKRIPQLKEGRTIPPTARVDTYHVATRYGLIWICLADEPAFAIPDYPEWGGDTFRTVRMVEDEPTRTSARCCFRISDPSQASC